MLKYVRDFNARFANHNFRVLWAEAVVLAVIIGAGLASWPGIIILLVATTWLLNRQWGKTIYLIGLFSCAWSFLAGMIGFGLGGWAWALLLGTLAFISGMKIHYRDLKRPFVSEYIEQFSNEKWRKSWNLGRQNMN